MKRIPFIALKSCASVLGDRGKTECDLCDMYKMDKMEYSFFYKNNIRGCIMKKSVLDLIYGNVTNRIKSQGNDTNGNVTESN